MTDRQTDGQTDRQTDRILIAIPRLHYMQRGKNTKQHNKIQKKDSKNKTYVLYIIWIDKSQVSKLPERTLAFPLPSKFSPEKFHQVNQVSTPDALCSVR